MHLSARDAQDLDREQIAAHLESLWCALLDIQPKDSDAHSLRELPKLGEMLGRGSKADGPLWRVFMDSISLGFYPPPEVLLAVYDNFNEYIEAEGAKTLETVFFGRPTKKSGNFAARRHAELKKGFLALRTELLMRKGMSQIAAAETVACEAEKAGYGAIDAETIARVHRDQPNLLRLRKKKAIKNPVHLKR